VSDLEPITPWLHAAIVTTSIDPEWIIVDPEFAARLTTAHERVFELAAHNTITGPEQLSPELPNVAQSVLDTLDEHGLIRVGERVAPGSVLIGKVTPRPGTLSPEEKLLRAIFGESVGEVRDTSLRCPPGCFGIVRAAQLLEPDNDDERARARVTIAWERPLAIGDELLIEGGARALVAKIEPLAGDVAWRGGSGSIRVAKLSMARDVIHGRSIGPYSHVIQQPRAGQQHYGGQLFTRGQARRLAAHAPWTLWEMLTIKSDSVGGRMRAYELLVRRENANPLTAPQPPEPSDDTSLSLLPPVTVTPETILVITRELQALGLEVDFDQPQVGVRLLSAEQIRERSHGQVTRAETLDYRTLAPEPDGLFCQRIFGPVNDYECACGKYKRMKYRGTTCESCGVEVTRSAVRRERFGHVELAGPVVHPLFLAEVALLLDISLTQLRKVLAGESGLDGSDSAPRGPAAVCAALAERELGWIEAKASKKAARQLAASLRERGLSPRCFVLDVVAVLPPELRPLVPLDSGRFASSDLNDLYTRFIGRNARTRQLLEMQAPAVIIDSEMVTLQKGVELLFANEQLKKPVRSGGRVQRSLLGCIEQHIAKLDSKQVEFSAVARLIADPEVPTGSCKLPRSLATELFRPIAYGIMEADGWVTTIKSAKQAIADEKPFALEAVEQAGREAVVLLMSPECVVARTVTLWDEPAIAVDPATARLLDTLDVRVHLPLSDEATAECRTLEDDPPACEPATSGWLARALDDPSEIAKRLRGAVIEGELDPVEDPLLRAALGRAPSSTVHN
jgi:hypothetical protein